jgi:hypothetical protein
MQTGHLASSHSLTFSSESEEILGDRLLLLELQGNGENRHLSRETERSLLSFGILLFH